MGTALTKTINIIERGRYIKMNNYVSLLLFYIFEKFQNNRLTALIKKAVRPMQPAVFFRPFSQTLLRLSVMIIDKSSAAGQGFLRQSGELAGFPAFLA